MKLISWQKDFHLKRSREVAGVLIGHGWDCLRENLELATVGRVHHNGAGDTLTRPEHLRRALEELDTTFIKPGQILSTRADLLPANT